jgi:hypothetical protein
VLVQWYSHFGCEWLIDIVEFVGGYLVNTSFPEEIRMKITINEKQHVLCRPRHRIITMSECPRNVLRVSVSTSTRNAGESGVCNKVGHNKKVCA